MPARAGRYLDLLTAGNGPKFRQVEGEPKGVTEAVLHRHPDGSYSHVLRIAAGVEIPGPAVHEFYEEVYYIEGEMLNRGTGETIRGGMYVFHNPGEPHGPFRCVKPCLLVEFRYYR